MITKYVCCRLLLCNSKIRINYLNWLLNWIWQCTLVRRTHSTYRMSALVSPKVRISSYSQNINMHIFTFFLYSISFSASGSTQSVFSSKQSFNDANFTSWIRWRFYQNVLQSECDWKLIRGLFDNLQYSVHFLARMALSFDTSRVVYSFPACSF